MSSYGEFAQVDSDLVFVLVQGQKSAVETRDLISVPRAKVDMVRTLEYANALRAAEYAANRGEREYQALTGEIAYALAALEASDDRDRRLGIAQVARARLTRWPDDHFGYRAAELRQLVSMIDEVIIELQAATGISHFSLDLVANVAPPVTVPLLSAPTPIETVWMALAAVAATDVGVEKLALLRSAERVLATLPGHDALRSEVVRTLAEETAVEAAYRTLLTDAMTRADVAVRQGRPAVIRRLIANVEAADERLGRRRVRDVANAMRRLQSETVLAIDQKAALDRWAAVKDQFRAYEVRLRSVLDGWASYATTLATIRNNRVATPGTLDAAARRFGELDRALQALLPPDELLHVHGIFRSAVQMARQGLLLGQRLAVAHNDDLSRNASSAITGADLLRTVGLKNLATALKPQRVR